MSLMLSVFSELLPFQMRLAAIIVGVSAVFGLVFLFFQIKSYRSDKDNENNQ